MPAGAGQPGAGDDAAQAAAARDQRPLWPDSGPGGPQGAGPPRPGAVLAARAPEEAVLEPGLRLGEGLGGVESRMENHCQWKCEEGCVDKWT